MFALLQEAQALRLIADALIEIADERSGEATAMPIETPADARAACQAIRHRLQESFGPDPDHDGHEGRMVALVRAIEARASADDRADRVRQADQSAVGAGS